MKFKEALQKTPVYGLTCAEYFPEGNIASVRAMIQSGITIIQYREKKLSKKEMWQEVQEIKKITTSANVLLIINDHLDLCLAVNADGIHLGQDDFPVEQARAILGKDKIIGLSTHNPQQALASQKLPIDYIGAGPIYTTGTKPKAKVAGIEYAKFVATNIQLPHIAIGGITVERCQELAKNGVKQVCLVQNLLSSKNMAATVKKITKILNH